MFSIGKSLILYWKTRHFPVQNKIVNIYRLFIREYIKQNRRKRSEEERYIYSYQQ